MLEVLRKSPALHVGGGKTVTLRNVRRPAKTLSLSAEALVVNGNRARENPHPGPLPLRGEGTDGGESPETSGASDGNGVVSEPSPSRGRGQGEGIPVAIVFGPENGAISEKLVYEAAREAYAKSYVHLYVIGFAIQPNARDLVEKCDQVVGVPATYVQATPDLMMGDLLSRSQRSAPEQQRAAITDRARKARARRSQPLPTHAHELRIPSALAPARLTPSCASCRGSRPAGTRRGGRGGCRGRAPC